MLAVIIKLSFKNASWLGSKPGTLGSEIGPSSASLAEGLSTIVKPVFARPPSKPLNVNSKGKVTSISLQSRVLMGEQPTMGLSPVG